MMFKNSNVLFILFMLGFLSTVVAYFASNQNIEITWYFGGATILLYLIYRLPIRKNKLNDDATVKEGTEEKDFSVEEGSLNETRIEEKKAED